MINWHDELQSAIDRIVIGFSKLQVVADRVMESPKTTVAASAVSTALGLASFQQLIAGLGASLAVWAGLLGVLILARLNWIKSENEKIRTLLLKEKAKEMGVDLLGVDNVD